MAPPRPITCAALLAALCFEAAQASATPPGESESLAAPARACPQGQRALASIACQLSQGLLPHAAGAPVRVVALRSDRELPTAGALRESVRSAVESALRGAPTPARRAKLNVELSIEKRGGSLRVKAELRRSLGLWQRLLHQPSAAERQAFAKASLDAELRALIPPPPLVARETLKLRAPERGIIAMACGALGEDGTQELLLLSRSSLRVGRIVNKAFVERKRAAWSALSSVAAVPLREPIATAELTAQGTIRVGITDREDGLELSRELSVLQRYPGSLPAPAGACFARSGLGLLGAPGPCGEQAQASRAPVVLDAVAGNDGRWFGRELQQLRLVSSRTLSGARKVGAQLAAGDLDGDGDAELAFSEDTSDPTKDRVTVVTIASDKLTTRFELAVPAVRAVALCELSEGSGMAPLVVASGDELWLIR